MRAGSTDRPLGVRLATAMLVSTFLDDGVRELLTFHAQCAYLESPLNHIVLPHALAAAYVLLSLLTQLGAGGYVLLAVLCSPSSSWRHLRTASLCLSAFVLSSLLLYGVGQPASQHAQGRAVFLLRNASLLGGLLLLLASTHPSHCMRQLLRLAARLLLALHALELAPAQALPVVLLVDAACVPLALLLALGLFTRHAAALLAAAAAAADLCLNHFWYGFRYNDNIRYYFFEDLALVGGLALFALTAREGEDVGLDSCRARGRELRDAASIAEKRALLDGDEWDVGD